jgi:hypothetical protein
LHPLVFYGAFCVSERRLYWVFLAISQSLFCVVLQAV